MIRDRLFVVFHASAAVDAQKQDELKKATFDHFPHAAYCSQIKGNVYAEKKGSMFINGENLSQAVDTIRKQARDKTIALVTLCPEMMKAASGEDITLITVGIPPVGANFGRGFYHADTAYVDNSFKAIARPFNR